MSDVASRQHACAKRILVVEDDDLNSKLLQDLIELQGYAVTATDFGLAAIELARRDPPDLILLDLKLPDISGFEVAVQLKADRRTHLVPILAVTACAMPGDSAKAIANGCDAYITKPLRINALIDTVEALLRRHHDPQPVE